MAVSRGVVYLNQGTKHLCRLLVSLYGLRERAGYRGPVLILNAGGDEGIIERIAGDDRLGVESKAIPTKQYRRNTCYVAKASMWRHSPFDTTVFLDADTLPVEPIDDLFEAVESDISGGLIVTHFSDWVTTGRTMSGRINKWQGIASPELIAHSLSNRLPAVNTGVLGWQKDRAEGILQEWEKLSQTGHRMFMADELAMQLVLPKFPHWIIDDSWNCSPRYGKHKANVKIWHFHGNRQCEPQALPIWWPVFQECLDLNIGGIRNWYPAGDKRLGQYLQACGGVSLDSGVS